MQCAKQLAVAVRLVRALAPGKLDGLVDIERLAASLAGAVLGRIDGRDIKPRAGKQIAESASLRFIDDRVDANVGGHPVVKRHIAPFEDQAQLLPVHPAGLVEAMIEVDQDRRAVAHGAMDVLFERG